MIVSSEAVLIELAGGNFPGQSEASVARMERSGIRKFGATKPRIPLCFVRAKPESAPEYPPLAIIAKPRITGAVL